MILQSLSLTNFRNYSKASFDFSPQTTLVLGPNAVGKTNLLEAVYYLACGKSFRATYDRESIRRSESLGHLRGGIDGNDGFLELEFQLLANENGENTSSKRFKVNGVKKRRADFVGNLRSVYFGPEEILLVTGSPSKRRKFMDAVLVQVDREYARALSEYEKVLRQRNRLLLLIREGDQSREQLDLWDPKLLHLGSVLSEKRQEMFADFNSSALLRVGNLFLEYQPKVVNDKVLEKGREREIAAGMTLWGPHRDDFRFLAAPSGSLELHSIDVPLADPSVAFRDLAIYGSRGEQRLAVLHLKLAELEFITKRVGERPILLLDDIFSELDESNRGRVLSLLGKQQTIITATDLDQIDGDKEIKGFALVRLI